MSYCYVQGILCQIPDFQKSAQIYFDVVFFQNLANLVFSCGQKYEGSVPTLFEYGSYERFEFIEEI